MSEDMNYPVGFIDTGVARLVKMKPKRIRPIKFRGKRVDGGGWVYGVGVTDRIFSIPEELPSTRAWLFVPPPDDNGGWVEVVPETVGEFTNLKDKNGVEIYEGDILHFVYESNNRDEIVLCKWYQCLMMWQFTNRLHGTQNNMTITNSDTLEVIGNIHDNPELLES